MSWWAGPRALLPSGPPPGGSAPSSLGFLKMRSLTRHPLEQIEEFTTLQLESGRLDGKRSAAERIKKCMQPKGGFQDLY